MTAEAIQSPAAPQSLYRSPWGLLPFQQVGVLRAYSSNTTLAVWDCGTGKGHLSLATAALLFEDDLVDLHLVVCEQNKVSEWIADLATFTGLRASAYYGTLAQRRKILSAVCTGLPTKITKTVTVDRPQVLVSTYETFRNDMATKAKVDNGRGRMMTRLVPGPMSLALEGQRLLVSYDEVTKLGNRGSGLHKAHALFVDHVRSHGGSVRLLGLTATPIDRSPENYYNLGRILCPGEVGTVATFETDHVVSHDQFGNASQFKNLTPETTFEPWVKPLSVKMAGVLLRKRKTDPDVVAQFPDVSEKYVHVDLGERHAAFYAAVLDTFADADEMERRQTVTLMRMIAGHPLALLHSQGKAARAIVDEVGEAGLAALGSAKLDVLVARLLPLTQGQGARAIVFSFFGPSMIPLIAKRLDAEGITVATNYPALGDKARAENKAAFVAGERSVFLTSDAGARGINLPQASYAFEYEGSLSFSNRIQRLNRIHRLTSRDHGQDKVYFQTLIARDTIEEGIAAGVMRRNAWADELLEDDDVGEKFISATMRKGLLQISKNRPL